MSNEHPPDDYDDTIKAAATFFRVLHTEVSDVVGGAFAEFRRISDPNFEIPQHPGNYSPRKRYFDSNNFSRPLSDAIPYIRHLQVFLELVGKHFPDTKPEKLSLDQIEYILQIRRFDEYHTLLDLREQFINAAKKMKKDQ